MARLAVEGVLLHTRALTDFLSPRSRGPKADDVLATQFSEKWTLSDDVMIGDWPLKQLRVLMDKKLAHISYERIKVTAWPVRKIADDVERLVRQFVETLPPDRQKWFQRRARRQRSSS